MSENKTQTIESAPTAAGSEKPDGDKRNHAVAVNGDGGDAPSETPRTDVQADANQTGETDDNQNNDAEKSKPNWFARIILIGVALLAVALLLILGIVPRIMRGRETQETAEQRQNALPKVNVAKPQLAPETSEIVLSGTTQAAQETGINARASGFVTRRLADIGDRVRAGQLLAEIDTPEIDEQLRQARQQVTQAEQEVAGARQEVAGARQGLIQAQAGLRQAEAGFGQARTNENLANVTSRRSSNLARKGLVSRQESDERDAALAARKADTEVADANIGDRRANIGAQQAVINARLANVEAQQANVEALKSNVRRLQDLQSFRRIVAPYSGIITARNVDVGGLVSGGGTSSPTTTGAESGGGTAGGNAQNAANNGLFRIARLDAMRTYVDVPQTFASSVTTGLTAQIEIKELPQRNFEGRVTRTSNSLDPNSRTLLAEVLIGNESGQLLPGMYAQIKFKAPRAVRAVMIPSSALISRADGTSIIIVRPDNTIHYQKVEVGRDYGKQIEILNGLDENVPVVTNPTDSLRENAKVEAREAPAGEGEQQNKQGGSQPNQQPENRQSGSQPNSGGK